MPQVNGQNVVKVGHRQVVNMIRQGGNSLMVKVVMVTRNPDMEEGSRKKSKSLLSSSWSAILFSFLGCQIWDWQNVTIWHLQTTAQDVLCCGTQVYHNA